MGKYLPSKKDHKANLRYQQKQLTQSKFIKPVEPKPAATTKDKKKES